MNAGTTFFCPIMFAHSLRNIGLVFVACTTFNLVVSIPTSGQTIESWEVLSALDRTTAVAALEDGGALIGTTGGAYRIDASNAIVDTWRSNGELLRLDVSAVGEDPSTGDLYFGAADGFALTWSQALEAA